MSRSIRADREQGLPRELLRSTPRPVGLTRTGVAAVVFAIAAVPAGAAVGAALYGLALRNAEQTRMLAAEGREAIATVTRVRSARGERREVRLDYRYAADGAEYFGRVKLRKQDPRAARIQEGDSIAVRYVPSRADRSWVHGYGPRVLPLWLGPAVGSALALAAIPVWLLLHRERRLLENGRAALARVVDPKTVDYGRGNPLRVNYEWKLLSGAAQRGHYDATEKSAAIGMLFPVLYDPEQPGRRSVYPLRLVRVKEM